MDLEVSKKPKVCWFPFKEAYTRKKRNSYQDPPNVYYLKQQGGGKRVEVSVYEYEQTFKNQKGETELVLGGHPKPQRSMQDDDSIVSNSNPYYRHKHLAKVNQNCMSEEFWVDEVVESGTWACMEERVPGKAHRKVLSQGQLRKCAPSDLDDDELLESPPPVLPELLLEAERALKHNNSILDRDDSYSIEEEGETPSTSRRIMCGVRGPSLRRKKQLMLDEKKEDDYQSCRSLEDTYTAADTHATWDSEMDPSWAAPGAEKSACSFFPTSAWGCGQAFNGFSADTVGRTTGEEQGTLQQEPHFYVEVEATPQQLNEIKDLENFEWEPKPPTKPLEEVPEIARTASLVDMDSAFMDQSVGSSEDDDDEEEEVVIKEQKSVPVPLQEPTVQPITRDTSVDGYKKMWPDISLQKLRSWKRKGNHGSPRSVLEDPRDSAVRLRVIEGNDEDEPHHDYQSSGDVASRSKESSSRGAASKSIAPRSLRDESPQAFQNSVAASRSRGFRSPGDESHQDYPSTRTATKSMTSKSRADESHQDYKNSVAASKSWSSSHQGDGPQQDHHSAHANESRVSATSHAKGNKPNPSLPTVSLERIPELVSSPTRLPSFSLSKLSGGYQSKNTPSETEISIRDDASRTSRNEIRNRMRSRSTGSKTGRTRSRSVGKSSTSDVPRDVEKKFKNGLEVPKSPIGLPFERVGVSELTTHTEDFEMREALPKSLARIGISELTRDSGEEGLSKFGSQSRQKSLSADEWDNFAEQRHSTSGDSWKSPDPRIILEHKPATPSRKSRQPKAKHWAEVALGRISSDEDSEDPPPFSANFDDDEPDDASDYLRPQHSEAGQSTPSQQIMRSPRSPTSQRQNRPQEEEWNDDDFDLTTDAFQRYAGDDDDSIFGDLKATPGRQEPPVSLERVRTENTDFTSAHSRARSHDFVKDDLSRISRASSFIRGDITTFTEAHSVMDEPFACMDDWLD